MNGYGQDQLSSRKESRSALPRTVNAEREVELRGASAPLRWSASKKGENVQKLIAAASFRPRVLPLRSPYGILTIWQPRLLKELER